MKAKKSPAPKKTKTQKKYYYNFLGLVTAVVFYALSMLPSLLPRPWVFQALISGASLAVGYGIGTFVSFAIRWMFEAKIPSSETIRAYAWKIFHVVAPLAIFCYVLFGISWQNDVRALVGQPTTQYWYAIPVLLLTFAVAIGLVNLSRLIRKAFRWFRGWVGKYVPRRISIAVSVFIFFLLFSWVTTGVFGRFFVNVTNNIYSERNDTIPEGVTQPTSKLRSGSSESIISWEDIGFQGRNFVGRGPTTEQISKFQGAEAKEPMRLYVGLKSAPSAQERADLAVAELVRTGAFTRKVLLIANVTGTGWLEPQTVDSFEYMYGGDTAIIAQQYSYLPSWISFLVDQENATNSGMALFDAVHAAWAKLPPDSRPKLLTYGLSLGSYSGNAAFTGVNHLRLSVDGALFVGTPSNTRLWSNITAQRDAGSPQWQPTYKDGVAVRFAHDAETINADQSRWEIPRLLYVQHASDPVVWFDFSLMTQEPDWLREPRGNDVSPLMNWYPFVTFAQVAVDQFFGTSVPNGHGHNYPNVMVDAWAAVLRPQDWTNEKASALKRIISGYKNE